MPDQRTPPIWAKSIGVLQRSSQSTFCQNWARTGTDARALVDALRRSNGRLRGVAVATGEITEAQFNALHEAGVRGFRFNEKIDIGTGQLFKGAIGTDQLKLLAPRMKEYGWHAQIWASCSDCVRLAREFAKPGLPLVFEHMSAFNVERGTGDAAFQDLLALLREGLIWVKLSLCRVSKARPDYADLRPFHDLLIEANASHLLWASDWPFVRMGEMSPDAGHLADLSLSWVGNAEIARRILAEIRLSYTVFESERTSGT